MRNYPELTEFEVRDLFADDNIESWLGNNYVVDFYTSECLSTKKQMEIDTDVKSLFEMLSPNKKMNKKPRISCFFDCGDGEGFNFSAEYGYKH
jgi:flavodoxin